MIIFNYFYKTPYDKLNILGYSTDNIFNPSIPDVDYYIVN
jgi:hypothetical protein